MSNNEDKTSRAPRSGDHSPRLPAIDALTSLRSLAALWVVAHHFHSSLEILLPGLHWLAPLLEIGHVAVPFFFILSGYVLAYNYAADLRRVALVGYWTFVARRFARIYPVHLVALLCVLAMILASGLGGVVVNRLDKFSWTDLVLNLFLVQTWVPDFHLNWNGPAWSISSEWFAYLLFPFVCPGLDRLARTRQVWIGLALSWAASVWLATYQGVLPFRYLLSVVPTFLMGCVLHALTTRLRDRGNLPRRLPDILALAVVVVPFLVAAVPDLPERTRYETIMTILITLFAALIFCFAHLGNDCSAIWRRPAPGLCRRHFLFAVHDPRPGVDARSQDPTRGEVCRSGIGHAPWGRPDLRPRDGGRRLGDVLSCRKPDPAAALQGDRGLVAQQQGSSSQHQWEANHG